MVLIVLPIIKTSRGSLIVILWGGRGGGSEEEVEGGGDGGICHLRLTRRTLPLKVQKNLASKGCVDYDAALAWARFALVGDWNSILMWIIHAQLLSSRLGNG